MCPLCKGLGETKEIDLDHLINFDKSLNEGAINFPTFQPGGWRLTRYTETGSFDNDKKLRTLQQMNANFFCIILEVLLFTQRNNGQKHLLILGLFSELLKVLSKNNILNMRLNLTQSCTWKIALNALVQESMIWFVLPK